MHYQVESWFYLQGDNFLHFREPAFAYAYYQDYRINLISGEKQEYDLKLWLVELDELKLYGHSSPRVIKLYYELGHIFEKTKVRLSNDTLLGIDILYSEVQEVELKERPFNLNLELISSVDINDYRERFQAGYKHLEKGNCYQFNLTFPFKFKTQTKRPTRELVLDFLANKRAAYGHATIIEKLNLCHLSQSPECLFQGRKEKDKVKIWSMPIKGTLKRTSSKRKDWKQLKASFKDECELNMITDLLRNDLSRIEKPTTEVVVKKAPLFVPGIVHQFSLVANNFSKEIGLGKIIKKVFPGGSVTGAPKKRVMEILEDLEISKRNIYCGSTILLYKEKICASINIRTAYLNTASEILTYHAGGGITLLSRELEEFEEMWQKLISVFPNMDHELNLIKSYMV